jgi:hypothetical protein
MAGIVGPIVAYVLGQGLADRGKEAAQITADAKETAVLVADAKAAQ